MFYLSKTEMPLLNSQSYLTSVAVIPKKIPAENDSSAPDKLAQKAWDDCCSLICLPDKKGAGYESAR